MRNKSASIEELARRIASKREKVPANAVMKMCQRFVSPALDMDTGTAEYCSISGGNVFSYRARRMLLSAIARVMTAGVLP